MQKARHQILRQNASALRANMTLAERKLWAILRAHGLGCRFIRQYIFDNKYIVDFYCPQKKLIIELDGGQHCDNIQDKIRDEYLAQRGCRILRFWNNEILSNIDGCLALIKEKLEEI